MLRSFDEHYGDQFYKTQLMIHIDNPYIRIFLGEFLATFVASAVAIGATCQAGLSYELAFPNRTVTITHTLQSGNQYIAELIPSKHRL
jgi:hypothetical protein